MRVEIKSMLLTRARDGGGSLPHTPSAISVPTWDYRSQISLKFMCTPKKEPRCNETRSQGAASAKVQSMERVLRRPRCCHGDIAEVARLAGEGEMLLDIHTFLDRQRI
jgi:hypothetical protein